MSGRFVRVEGQLHDRLNSADEYYDPHLDEALLWPEEAPPQLRARPNQLLVDMLSDDELAAVGEACRER